MPDLSKFAHGFVNVHGIHTELLTRGEGRPILFLHSEDWLFGSDALLNRLSSFGRLIVPSHPGFGRSELPHSISTTDDLAYFYLDLMELLDLEDVVLIGSSFGGWIAAQVAIKCTSRIRQLVLVDPLGIKIGDREARDIVDMHAVADDELVSLSYSNPAAHRFDFSSFSDDDLFIFARNKETFTHLAWRPYMHDPKLRGLLRRIRVPTLVLWGAQDRIVSPDYGKAFSSEIAGSRFCVIPGAGHFPCVEQPEAVCSHVASFVGATAP